MFEAIQILPGVRAGTTKHALSRPTSPVALYHQSLMPLWNLWMAVLSQLAMQRSTLIQDPELKLKFGTSHNPWIAGLHKTATQKLQKSSKLCWRKEMRSSW